MASLDQSRQNAVREFSQQHPNIPYVVPSSPDYAALRATFIVDNPAVPIAIARPQNADDVAAIVKFCVARDVPFVVRSGGNNLFGKSQVDGALTIDMRDVQYCHVDESKTSARIGGGILAGTLVQSLSQEGVVTASGTVHFIGYVGWSTYGGYGPFSANFGYGFEQILAAKVVNSTGEIIDADSDLLRGIRGAGGSFGIIVEMTIRVRPLTKILSGFMVYDTSKVINTVATYCQGLQGLRDDGWPDPLCVAPLFLCTPDGLKLLSHFMWSEDNEAAGTSWLERVSQLGRNLHNGVRRTTILEAMGDFNRAIPQDGRGSVNTVSLRRLTDECIAVIAKYVECMPRYVGNGFAIHVAPKPAQASVHDSVFAVTEAHYMLELLATPRSEEGLHESQRWGADFVSELLKTGSSNILPSTYINLTPPGRTTLQQVYGDNFTSVMELKEKYDPHGVFKLATPFSYIPPADSVENAC
ncbi:hypothetical protein PFICI_06521 [Pestalotiopsis fici W106-1]|uniref:FAD-binding PCMH-type domain-containing protein n=1 Tax=Pestalotiopsis fici (strain W106-1 / CGMCC3.15140) TaxID=1229662 RepID=W3X656_PESFW|nr:uncharacterized protein PFICI_06521 [Pestalotiopsis fici W106-1]ETS81519.1 hypothetical protein PFICI_06521 [Pestalotiopsis fici W106-1]